MYVYLCSRIFIAGSYLILCCFLPPKVKNCTVGIVDDDVFEDDETFFLKLTRPLGTDTIGARIGDVNSTEITVTNLDDGNYVIPIKQKHIKMSLN